MQHRPVAVFHPLFERRSGVPALERRSAVRYKLQLPVIFHWDDGEGHTEAGFTYDVALDGVCIRSKVCPALGADIRIELLLPSPDAEGLSLRIHCIGKVRRVFSHDGIVSFGVEGDFDDADLTREVLK